MTQKRLINSLVLKSNRLLGTSIVDFGLISLQQLEAANEVFLQRLKEGNPLLASLLHILIYEHQSLQEDKLIDTQLREFDVFALNLDSYLIDEDYALSFDMAECKATRTLPVDIVSDTVFLCSSYYLNPFIRDFWEEKIGTEIFWFISPFNQIEEAFDKMAPDPTEEIG